MEKEISRRPGLLLMILLAGLGGLQLRAQESDPGAAGRYRLVQVVEASILQEKINEAAHEGYRMAGVAPGSGGTTVAVLEKTANPEDAYSYLPLGGKGDATLQQALNDAGAKGFRLVSRDIALDWRTPPPMQLRPVLAWMEKSPGPARKFGYAVVPFGAKMSLKASLNPKLWADFNPLDYVKAEIKNAEDRGFRLVRIVSGVALIMEKADMPEGGEPAQPKSSSGVAQSQAYRSLSSLKGSKLQRKLQQEAADGYCVVDIDPEAPPIWPSILLDKSRSTSAEGASKPCDYEVIQKRDLGEDDFNQAGARGFRLVPQSLNSYAAFQTAQEGRPWPEVNAIFEKSTAASQAYHYRNLAASELSVLSGSLEQAGAEGYRVVKLDTAKDGGVLVIMQKSEEQTSK
jgi:hypothetical protein